jgi:hydrogenase maturation protease
MIRAFLVQPIFSSYSSIVDEVRSLAVDDVMPPSKLIVIGIGNPYRGDDAAGLIVARRLQEQPTNSCEVHERAGEGTALMELWKGAQRVVVIDAVESGALPGKIHRFQANLEPLPAPIFRDSTHAFGLVEAVALSRALHQLPVDLLIYGIEGENFEAGSEPSRAVLSAIHDLVRELRQAIDQSPGEQSVRF